mgnify:CR=1 FL=1
MVAMIEGTTLILNDTGESIEVGSGGGSSDLSAETVTTDGSHRDLSLVHPSDDIGGKAVHIVRVVMVRFALVTVVEKPDIAHVEHLVFTLTEELFEVLCGFSDLWKPDHRGEISLATLHESALELNLIASCSNSRLYNHIIDKLLSWWDLLAKFLAERLVMANQDLVAVDC